MVTKLDFLYVAHLRRNYRKERVENRKQVMFLKDKGPFRNSIRETEIYQ